MDTSFAALGDIALDWCDTVEALSSDPICDLVNQRTEFRLGCLIAVLERELARFEGLGAGRRKGGGFDAEAGVNGVQPFPEQTHHMSRVARAFCGPDTQRCPH